MSIIDEEMVLFGTAAMFIKASSMPKDIKPWAQKVASVRADKVHKIITYS